MMEKNELALTKYDEIVEEYGEEFANSMIDMIALELSPNHNYRLRAELEAHIYYERQVPLKLQETSIKVVKVR